MLLLLRWHNIVLYIGIKPQIKAIHFVAFYFLSLWIAMIIIYLLFKLNPRQNLLIELDVNSSGANFLPSWQMAKLLDKMWSLVRGASFFSQPDNLFYCPEQLALGSSYTCVGRRLRISLCGPADGQSLISGPQQAQEMPAGAWKGGATYITRYTQSAKFTFDTFCARSTPKIGGGKIAKRMAWI